MAKKYSPSNVVASDNDAEIDAEIKAAGQQLLGDNTWFNVCTVRETIETTTVDFGYGTTVALRLGIGPEQHNMLVDATYAKAVLSAWADLAVGKSYRSITEREVLFASYESASASREYRKNVGARLIKDRWNQLDWNGYRAISVRPLSGYQEAKIIAVQWLRSSTVTVPLLVIDEKRKYGKPKWSDLTAYASVFLAKLDKTVEQAWLDKLSANKAARMTNYMDKMEKKDFAAKEQISVPASLPFQLKSGKGEIDLMKLPAETVFVMVYANADEEKPVVSAGFNPTKANKVNAFAQRLGEVFAGEGLDIRNAVIKAADDRW